MKQTCLKMLKAFFSYYLLFNFLIGILVSISLLITPSPETATAVGAVVIVIVYLLRRKKIDKMVPVVNAAALGIDLCVFTILMIALKGNADAGPMTVMAFLLIPFLVPFLLMSLMLRVGSAVFLLLILVAAGTLCSYLALCLKDKKLLWWKQLIACCLAAAILLSTNGIMYANRPEAKYSGHGFDYMRGYSSTDFSDYMVYSEPSKLAYLEETATLRIEGEENMPVMDGAEACYPLYASIAKAVYVDIEDIEKQAIENEREGEDRLYANGKIVTFTNTIQGYIRLLFGDVDLFFGARPSEEQLEEAKESGVELECTQIGREAFVFFVEADNPVTDLSSEEVRAIYHGDITNWKEVGGKDEEIRAFQRPANSGSQTMMEYFMGEVPLKEPESYEIFSSMDGVIRRVAQYANEEGAMGYSFHYFVEELSQEKNVHILSIDGVAPTLENVENGSYPLTVGLYMISRKNDPSPYVRQMIEFLLSPQGQELVRKSGYAGLPE